jgi:predicted nucleic acid-binding protein
LLPQAYRIAVETGRTVYDCLYLALAQVHGCTMVTADERFYNALSHTPHSNSVVWIGYL